MLCLKKVYSDELLQLAILLSLLRADNRLNLIEAPAVGVGTTYDSWDIGRSMITSDMIIHPKAIDTIMLREQDLFNELNSLGRYNSLWQDVTAYMGLTNTIVDPVASTSSDSSSSPQQSDGSGSFITDFKEEPADDLTQEDMDLIEILWKQDVDMGFSIEENQGTQNQSNGEVTGKEKLEKPSIKKELEPDIEEEVKEEKEPDPWTGKSYTIDLETGEYILKEESNSSPSAELSEDEPPSSLLPEPDFSLEEALELVGLNDGIEELLDTGGGAEEESNETKADDVIDEEIDAVTNQLQEELDILADMIQTPPYHPRHYQGRVGYSRTVSMEQRWQDLASLLSLPESQHYPHALHHHHHHHHHALSQYHQNPDTKPVMAHPNPSVPESQPNHYGTTLGANNVGSAVASSMNLMSNSSEPMAGEGAGAAFKMENNSEIMYYQQNATTEINHNSTEGFLSSILNDEDLQLMDMAMNEGMYTMRMLEGATAASNTNGGGDSDSAVSSMGSERVPSLTSDTEWMETNSDSGHTPADHYPSDYSATNKYRWYDYGCRQLSGESSRGPQVAQKKHHMYGRRVFQEPSPGATCATNGSCIPLKMEGGGTPPVIPPHLSPYPSNPLDARSASQPELKYSCSVEFSRQNLAQHGIRSTPAQIAAHNHTYHMLPESCGTQQRPLTRDKKGRKSEDDQHLSRDERRARSLNIPMAVDDIINLPMDEFNERLSKYDLSENQLSLIRDIRRRGKNKVAAQNCRKRKLDQILSLADEVRQMKDRKQRLLHERQVLLSERHRIKTKFSQLYKHIFQSLRDADGNPYSPYEWSLQQTADGSAILVPRGNQTMLDQTEPLPTRKPHDHHRTP